MGKLTVNIPEEVHQKVRDEVAADEALTTSALVQRAIEEYYQRKEGKQMTGNSKTLAFQVSEEFFQRIDRYLAAHPGLNKKAFITGLIGQALDAWENGQNENVDK